MKDIEQYINENDWSVALNQYNKTILRHKTGLEMSHKASVDHLLERFGVYNKPAIEDFLSGQFKNATRPKPLTLDEALLLMPDKIYFFNNRFYHRAHSDDGSTLWIGYSETSFRRYLGLYISKANEFLHNEVIRSIENERVLSDICTLAGYHEGVFTFQHGRTLITQSPIYIEPSEGKFPMLDRLLTEMLGEKQKEYFLGWLKVAVENLRNGPEYSVRGQALFLVGEIGTCKSLLQDIITYALGGRQADPHSYLIRDTTFNADLFGAEHLLLGDKRGQSWEERGDYSMGLKELIANNQHHRHEKGRTPQIYDPKWRITVSLNTDDDSLKVIPIITAGLEDKISILTVNKPHMEDVIPRDILRNDKTLLKVFCDELPQFIHHLLNVHKIKPELQANRFGVVAYRDTEIENKLKENINFKALYEVLYELLGTKTYKGTASTLIGLLKSKEIQLERGFNTPRDLGRTLSAMSDIPKYKKFIDHHETSGRTIWEIGLTDDSEFPSVPEEYSQPKEDPDWWKNVKL